MHALVGLELGGASVTERAVRLNTGALGEVCWGPTQLLRDLELRLGLSVPCPSRAVRVARFAKRMAKLAPQGRYYSRSFKVDALATAAATLELRDLLVEAAWSRETIPGGGVRLDALHELEHVDGPALPAGDADRTAAVADELDRRTSSPYAEIALVEPDTCWSTCWRRIFRSLERAGTVVSRAKPVLPAADPESDLGKLQRALVGSPVDAVDLRGDGSFAVITAETSWHAAQAVAATLGRLKAEATAVIRETDASALDNALSAAGVRTQGLSSVSPWRSALQVLPLSLELAFEPKDPYRVLELLTLPVGPFNGLVGHALARALAQAPGVGSPAWLRVKAQLSSREPSLERNAEQLKRIAEWLEAPGVDALTGAPIASLLLVLERVRDWLLSRIQSAPDDALLLSAARQAAALRGALESDPRPVLTLVQVRKLAEAVQKDTTATALLEELAGRAALVETPSRLRLPTESVVWWSFTDAASATERLPWRRHELNALTAAKLRFPDPGERLMERAAAARRAFCCATERLVLVAPRLHAGQPQNRHPLWDELVVSARLDEPAISRVTVSALALSDPAAESLLHHRPTLAPRTPVALPGGQTEWHVPEKHLTPFDRFSPASLEALLGCPLEWALRYRAGTRSGGHALPPLYLLNGSIGHRLVELLHLAGSFELDEAALRLDAESRLETLFRHEGAVLLRPGMAFERGQLTEQLVRAVLELSRLLRQHGLRIAAVEKPVEAPWQGGTLEGRLDLLVVDQNDEEAIVDIKGGISIYRHLLRNGRALQLAAYAFAHATERNTGRFPDAGYFSLKQGKLFGLESHLLPHTEVVTGPTLHDTWQRIERSITRALPLARRGRFLATGVRGALPVLAALDIAEREADAHYVIPNGERCESCHYDALCGRRWEALQ